MKKLNVLALLALAIVLSSVTINKTKHFKDGIFQGESRSKYTNEPYWGKVNLEIKNDVITLVSFKILDKEKNEVFGPNYERHFKNNPIYIEQCRSEIKGIKAYTESFLKNKSIEQVDAITGATWSYNIFRDALNVTLEKAVTKD